MSRLVAVLAGAVLALAGCGSPSPQADAPAAASGGGSAQDTVTMARSYVFEPSEISVDPGATVTWVNEDNFTHTVRIDDEVIGQAAPGESITHDFEESGSFAYDCSLHPKDMRGVVNVGS